MRPTTAPAITADAFDVDVSTPKSHPWAFYSINVLWLTGMLVGALFATSQWQTPLSLFGMAYISLGQCIIALQLLWIMLSVRELRVDEVGAIMLYGWTMIRIGRGPKLLIFGIFQMVRFTASVIQNQHPAEPELIQKTADEEPLGVVSMTEPDGTIVQRMKVRPMRITTSGPKAELGDDILNAQMTIEFTFWVRWIIVDAFAFIVNAGGDVERAIGQMRDSGESLLNVEVTQMTPSELFSKFKELEEKLKVAITNAVAPWGLKVVGVGLTQPDLNHKVAQSLRDIPVAKATARKTVIDADANAYKLSKEGEGRGKAREEELAGEGRGYKRAGEAIGVDPQTVLAAQVARDTVGQGDLILGTDGIAQVLGLGKRLLQNQSPPASPSAPTTPTDTV